jgi:hypothetical protein
VRLINFNLSLISIWTCEESSPNVQCLFLYYCFREKYESVRSLSSLHDTTRYDTTRHYTTPLAKCIFSKFQLVEFSGRGLSNFLCIRDVTFHGIFCLYSLSWVILYFIIWWNITALLVFGMQFSGVFHFKWVYFLQPIFHMQMSFSILLKNLILLRLL